MAKDSLIEWTKHTDNLWHGCVGVHEGCDNCYAEALAHRWGKDLWGQDKARQLIKSAFPDLAKYQEAAHSDGELHRVFVGSMMDIFEKPMPLVDAKFEPVPNLTTGELRSQLFMEISAGKYNNLLLLLLTKRASNIPKYIPELWRQHPRPNVMYGTSTVNQKTYNALWPHLARVKGLRFLSCEPMLGPINLRSYCPECKAMLNSLSPTCGTCHSATIRPDWVICGGESGPKKRPFNVQWAYDLWEQCRVWGIPFFMKQIDKVQPVPEGLLIRQFPSDKFQLPVK